MGLALRRYCPRWLEGGQKTIKHLPRVLPHIVAILKLLHVRLKMLPGNVDVRPANRQLQPCPKPLDPVNVTVAINILPCAMIHRLMLETDLGKPAVGFQFVGMNGAVFYHVFFDDRLKCFPCERSGQR